MNKEIADKWIAALRSGKYTQGTEYLRHKDHTGTETFCAFGVLCNELDPTNWVNESYVYDENGYFFSYNNISHYIDDDTFKMCGFNGENMNVNDYMDMIYSMNDCGGHEFPEIANFIEENWEKL